MGTKTTANSPVCVCVCVCVCDPLFRVCFLWGLAEKFAGLFTSQMSRLCPAALFSEKGRVDEGGRVQSGCVRSCLGRWWSYPCFFCPPLTETAPCPVFSCCESEKSKGRKKKKSPSVTSGLLLPLLPPLPPIWASRNKPRRWPCSLARLLVASRVFKTDWILWSKSPRLIYIEVIPLLVEKIRINWFPRDSRWKSFWSCSITRGVENVSAAALNASWKRLSRVKLGGGCFSKSN